MEVRCAGGRPSLSLLEAWVRRRRMGRAHRGRVRDEAARDCIVWVPARLERSGEAEWRKASERMVKNHSSEAAAPPRPPTTHSRGPAQSCGPNVRSEPTNSPHQTQICAEIGQEEHAN